MCTQRKLDNEEKMMHDHQSGPSRNQVGWNNSHGNYQGRDVHMQVPIEWENCNTRMMYVPEHSGWQNYYRPVRNITWRTPLYESNDISTECRHLRGRNDDHQSVPRFPNGYCGGPNSNRSEKNHRNTWRKQLVDPTSDNFRNSETNSNEIFNDHTPLDESRDRPVPRAALTSDDNRSEEKGSDPFNIFSSDPEIIPVLGYKCYYCSVFSLSFIEMALHIKTKYHTLQVERYFGSVDFIHDQKRIDKALAELHQRSPPRSLLNPHKNLCSTSELPRTILNLTPQRVTDHFSEDSLDYSD